MAVAHESHTDNECVREREQLAAESSWLPRWRGCYLQHHLHTTRPAHAFHDEPILSPSPMPCKSVAQAHSYPFLTVPPVHPPFCLPPKQELAKGPKLVLRADSEQQLLAAMEAARAAGIPHHSIAEAVSSSSSSGGGGAADAAAGAAAVPRKSRTILAFGPLPAEELPKVAAGLVLL